MRKFFYIFLILFPLGLFAQNDVNFKFDHDNFYFKYDEAFQALEFKQGETTFEVFDEYGNFIYKGKDSTCQLNTFLIKGINKYFIVINRNELKPLYHIDEDDLPPNTFLIKISDEKD